MSDEIENVVDPTLDEEETTPVEETPTEETTRTQDDIIANMTNIADSGQDLFVQDQKNFVKETLYNMGISRTYLDSEEASYILGKIVTDNVEDGKFSTTTEAIIASLRANHPHSEDEEDV